MITLLADVADKDSLRRAHPEGGLESFLPIPPSHENSSALLANQQFLALTHASELLTR